MFNEYAQKHVAKFIFSEEVSALEKTADRCNALCAQFCGARMARHNPRAWPFAALSGVAAAAIMRPAAFASRDYEETFVTNHA